MINTVKVKSDKLYPGNMVFVNRTHISPPSDGSLYVILSIVPQVKPIANYLLIALGTDGRLVEWQAIAATTWNLVR